MKMRSVLVFLKTLSFVTVIFTQSANATGLDLITTGTWPHVAKSTAPHTVQVLNSGPASLTRYFEMIERAQSEILILNYMMVPGNLGKILGRTLIDKKRQFTAQGKPLSIKIYVDYYGWAGAPAMNDIISKQFLDAGIELGYYNYAIRLDKLNYRDHRKIFIIDGKEFIVGGRSLEDGCFELGEDYYNYLDRDIWVRGPVAKAATADFYAYWNSPLTKTGAAGQDLISVTTKEEVEKVFERYGRNYPRGASQAKVYGRLYKDRVFDSNWAWGLDENGKERPEVLEALSKIKSRVLEIGKSDLQKSPQVRINQIAFVSASPELSTDSMYQRDNFNSVLNGTKTKALYENYAFVPAGEFKDILWKKLTEDKIRVLALTNSYISTDEKEIGYMNYMRQVKFRLPEDWNNSSLKGIDILAFDGKMPAGKQMAVDLTDEQKSITTWGIHAKTAVFDSKHVWIGSNNIDSRSMNYTKEAAVFIPDSPELAAITEKFIMERAARGMVVTTDGHYIDGDGKKIKAEFSGNPFELFKAWTFEQTMSEWLF